MGEASQIAERDMRLQLLANDALVDVNKEIVEPETVLEIFSNSKFQRLFTKSNISCVRGKAKAKKSTLLSLFCAATSSRSVIQNKLNGQQSDALTLYFDTEQAEHDTQNILKTIRSNRGKIENLDMYCLRELMPNERCDLIEYILSEKDCSFCVIDGVADLISNINDIEQANLIVNKLMKWSKIYNCHITNVIHENKDNNYATGHLGSALLKKAEADISVTKDADIWQKSIVKCENMRGAAHFEDFEIEINLMNRDVYINEVDLSSKSIQTYDQKIKKI